MDRPCRCQKSARVHEVQLTYAKKVECLCIWTAYFGYAKIKNADYTSGGSDSSKLAVVGPALGILIDLQVKIMTGKNMMWKI